MNRFHQPSLNKERCRSTGHDDCKQRPLSQLPDLARRPTSQSASDECCQGQGKHGYQRSQCPAHDARTQTAPPPAPMARHAIRARQGRKWSAGQSDRVHVQARLAPQAGGKPKTFEEPKIFIAKGFGMRPQYLDSGIDLVLRAVTTEAHHGNIRMARIAVAMRVNRAIHVNGHIEVPDVRIARTRLALPIRCTAGAHARQGSAEWLTGPQSVWPGRRTPRLKLTHEGANPGGYAGKKRAGRTHDPDRTTTGASEKWRLLRIALAHQERQHQGKEYQARHGLLPPRPCGGRARTQGRVIVLIE